MRSLAALCCLSLLGCAYTAADTAPAPDAAPSVENGSDWLKFLGPTGNGVSPEKGIITPWPKKGLRVVWHKTTGTGYGAPAVAGGRLFLCDRIDDNARIRCLKSTTGEELWKFEYPSKYEDFYGYDNGPRCCPIVDGDRVYMFGAEGMLHCLRTEDGKVVWKEDTAAKFGVRQNFFGVGAAPVIEGDLLLVQVGGSPKDGDDVAFGDLKSNGSAIVAFDKKTGNVKYKVGQELASYSSPVLATIGDRRWCFVFARGGLLAFDPATGKADFHFPWRAKVLESVNASCPVVVGDQVFITECYGPGSALLKVKPGKYEEVWTDADKGRQKAMQCHWNTPIYHDGHLYGSSGRHSNGSDLRCVELATGKVKWKEGGLNRSSLLMVDGHFIVLDESGELVLLKVNADKYEEVSRMEVRDPFDKDKALLKYPCWAAPVLSHGLLYIRGEGRMACLELIPQKK